MKWKPVLLSTCHHLQLIESCMLHALPHVALQRFQCTSHRRWRGIKRRYLTTMYKQKKHTNNSFGVFRGRKAEGQNSQKSNSNLKKSKTTYKRHKRDTCSIIKLHMFENDYTYKGKQLYTTVLSHAATTVLEWCLYTRATGMNLFL